MLYVAFRYPDPHGSKLKDNVKYTGWISSEYDMHVEIGAPNVMPFWSYTTQYLNVSTNEMKYDCDIQD